LKSARKVAKKSKRAAKDAKRATRAAQKHFTKLKAGLKELEKKEEQIDEQNQNQLVATLQRIYTSAAVPPADGAAR